MYEPCFINETALFICSVIDRKIKKLLEIKVDIKVNRGRRSVLVCEPIFSKADVAAKEHCVLAWCMCVS